MKEGDINTKGALYVLTDVAWSRIQPELTMEEQCNFMGSYFLERLATNPESNDYIHNGYGAAYEIAAWLKHLSTITEAESIIKTWLLN
jgi:hypothetical protein